MTDTVTVDVAVRGRDHYKYFRRPVGQSEAPPHIKYEAEKARAPTPPEKAVPKTRTVGTQSLYRESETQTVPYSPDYVLPSDGSEPEVLQLQRLGLEFGQGLPAGLDQVEIIERARQKRAFEASLPPLTGNSDPALFAQRQRMLEAQELEEQQYRANQLKKLHQEKLQQVESGLRSRAAERDQVISTRVDAMVTRRLSGLDDKLEKLQAEHVKEMRKLTDKHKNVEQKKEKRSIIDDHANFASKVHAAPAREGILKTGLGTTIGTTSNTFNNYAALEDMDMKVTQTMNVTKQELTGMRKPRMRRAEVQLATQLANVDAAITRSKNPKPAALPPPAVAQRIERPPPRPPTPTINSEQQTQLQQSDLQLSNLQLSNLQQTNLQQSNLQQSSDLQQFSRSRPPVRPPSTAPLSPSSRRGMRSSAGEAASAAMAREVDAEQQDAQTRAVILLQRLLRGRAMQNAMFEGKERRRELIQELRTEIPDDTLEQDNKWHTRVHAQEQRERRAHGAAAAVVGTEVASTLDFLAKELVRTRQLDEIRRMVRAAEAMRAQREAAEGEERRRREALRLRMDWEYREMQKVHSVTAVTFLSEITQEAVQHAAKIHAEAALADIQAQKERERMELMERMRGELGEGFDEEEWEVQHFVATFLLPAVDKEFSQQDVNVQADKHSMAVRDTLLDALLAL